MIKKHIIKCGVCGFEVTNYVGPEHYSFCREINSVNRGVVPPAGAEPKWFLAYHADCGPKLRSFSTRDALVRFVGEFALLSSGKSGDDNWIDYAFQGKLEGPVAIGIVFEEGDES